MLLKRSSLVLLFVTLVTSGCGLNGSGPGVGSSPAGALPHGAYDAGSTGREGSWMLGDTKNEDLIYASDMERKKLFVLLLSTGKLVGTISFNNTPWGLCSDRAGDVFVTRSASRANHGVVTEFSHGSTLPIAQRQVAPGITACAIDPTTGDLAVSSNTHSAPAVIAVYSPPFTGPPIRTISAATTKVSLYLAYDDKGNLYFPTGSESYGVRLFKLAKNNNVPVQIENVAVDEYLAGWHGRDLIFGADGGDNKASSVRISRHRGHVVHVTTLEGTDLNFASQVCIDGSVLVAPFYNHFVDDIGIWDFPSGKQIAALGGFGEAFLEGITISRARSAR